MKREYSPGKGTGVLKKLLVAAAITVFVTAVLLVSAFIMVPLEAVHGVMERNLNQRGLTVTSGEFRKHFPLGIDVHNLEISEAGGKGPVIYIDSLLARLSPAGIFSGGIMVLMNGEMGEGRLEGSVLARPGALYFDVKGSGIRLENVPRLGRTGIEMDGRFSGTAKVKLPKEGCPEGALRINSDELGRGSVKFRGMPLPFGELKEAGLSAVISGCGAKVEKAWVEGSELTALLSGDVRLSRPFATSALDLALELTPRGELLSNQALLSFISRYRKSANFYSMRITGTVGNPVTAP